MADSETEAPSETPPGPYSYVAERRAAQKRPIAEDGHSSRKRQHGGARPLADPIFGQTSALPDFDDRGDQDQDSRDCLKYMHAVRSEAIGLASFIAAPVNAMSVSDGVDDRGWFEEGAYVALPSENEQDPYDDDGQDGDVHAVQCRALCERFERHRDLLRRQPPASRTTALDQTKHPTAIPVWTKRNPGLRLWRHHLQANTPNPIQLAIMDNKTVLGVLNFAEDILRTWPVARSLPLSLGSWIWALLGRLEEVGQLTTDEVGVIRSLAKTAIQLFARYRAKLRQDVEAGTPDDDDDDDATRMDDNDPEDYDDQDDGNDEGTDDGRTEREDLPEASLEAIIAAKKAELARAVRRDDSDPVGAEGSEEKSPNPATLALLETIVIVAGQFYGQRDLLDARRYFWEHDAPWPS